MAGLVVLVLSVALFMLPDSAFAQKLGTGNLQGPNGNANLTVIVQTVINVLLSIIGVIAVVMLIIGGIRYTTSQGNEKAIEGAKNTILYAIIGIVVAFAAFALITFVINQLNSNGTAQ